MEKRIKKVLILTDISNPWSIGHYIGSGLQKNDIDVKSYDPRSVNSPYSVLMSLLDDFKPDMLLYFKDYGMKVEWLHEAKKKGILAVQWYPDLAIYKRLHPYFREADIFFTVADGLVDEFRKLNSNTFWLTQAFEPSFFHVKNISPADIKTYSADVTFVGTLGSKQYYLRRREYLSRVVKERLKFTWWGPRLPRKISTIPLLLGRLGRAYGGRFVWGEEYAKVAQLSKIFLAFDALPDIRKSMSARMYTAVGCGAFYMCEHVNGIEDVLVPGKEIVTFHSGEEMVDMIRYYLGNDDLRMKIGEAGRKRVLQEHTYEVRVRQMLRMIEDVA